MFGTVEIKTRPLRIAHLVDPNNTRQAREAIKISSTLWGGDYFPIIPLYKRMPATWREKHFKVPSAKSVILGYIEAFDPDIFIQFSKEIPGFISDIGIKIVKPDEIWSVLEEHQRLSPKYGLGIFELLNDIFDENFKFKRKYPVNIVFPQIPKQYSLFWASWFGEIPSKILLKLEKTYFEPLEIKKPPLETANIKKLLSGSTLFPSRITQHGIKRSSRSGFRRNSYIYFFDAMKTEDVIDFWNLRAIGKKVLPLPKQMQNDPHMTEVVVDFLKANRRHWKHNPQVCDYTSIVRARNCKMEELQDYAKTLKINRDPNDSSSDPFFSLQHWYPRVWDEWARDKDGAVPVDIHGEEETAIEIQDSRDFKISFKSMLPNFAHKHSYHGAPRCTNEINFRLYSSEEYIAEVLPKAIGANLERAISGIASLRGDWKIGRNGLIKFIKDNFNERREIPLAEKVFFAWLKDLGWEAQLSSSGLLAKQIYKKLGGFIAFLTNEKLLGLFEHMNGGLVKQDGSPVKDNKITQERDLSVGEVKSRLKNFSGRNNLHKGLVEKGIFKIGLKIQCPHCLRKSWYPLENVREQFACPRCLNKFSAIGNLDNSEWCYKTAGPFSVPNYADGAYAVLLTLDFLDEHRMHTMRTTPILSFVANAHGKINIEADFAAFWQESVYGEKREGILFGECKTYGVFQKKDFDRMRYLAKSFPGAVLIFSTLRKSLTKKEITGLTKIAKTGRKYWKAERPINPVVILTGNEVLNLVGPPYCWKDSVKEKFDHISGLIDLSNATQQIYLGLPSWETEWHENIERKHQKKLAKK